MHYILDHTDKPYLKFFEDICAIPHESFNEKAISEYIVQFAKDRGLWYYTDDLWNVVIKKPASPGYENRKPVMLQAHTDMVCEKTPDSDFNFDTDPLELYVEDGWLHARTTTLGADDGYGVAYMLAVLDDDTIPHPPLECFFSVQEEVGIGGPRGFKNYACFESRRIINLDANEEGTTNAFQTAVIGGEWKLPLAYGPAPKGLNWYHVHLDGFTAGHASLDHVWGRGTAIGWSLRVAAALYDAFGTMPLAGYSGGTFRNNLSRNADFTFGSERKLEDVAAVVAKIEAQAKNEHAETDPNLWFEVKKAEEPETVLTAESAEKALDFVSVLPDGISMLYQCERKVLKTANNLGIVRMERDGTAGTMTVGYMFRTSFKPARDEMFRKMQIIGRLFGATYNEEYRYSGYKLKMDGDLYKTWNQVYRDATGKDLYIKYTGGGNDVGTIMEGLGGEELCEAIGIAPDNPFVHTPREKLDLASFDRAYRYLLEVLKRL